MVGTRADFVATCAKSEVAVRSDNIGREIRKIDFME
jgi:hypothetical protein